MVEMQGEKAMKTAGHYTTRLMITIRHPPLSACVWFLQVCTEWAGGEDVKGGILTDFLQESNRKMRKKLRPSLLGTD